MSRNATTLPILFREVLSTAGMQAIDEWWAQLDERARSETLHLWHDCGQSESAPTVRIEARFADDHEDKNGDFWHSDYYEYLVNHEIYLFNVPGVHICTRHPVAAAAARLGVIPPDFACPFASADCPMHKLLSLSPGKPVKLRASLVAADEAPAKSL